ncbi:MAG TPA: DUF420 domain-containing protein [Saprospiraceae bacterium]|nr:DUF420 domain-containing protein [Saprospiraceae bacterium]HPQ21872.1 DUF420 domain-containing protein [Saprospiraceae bacterium]HRX29209.1 DUF420 domain-containing protein [Saprospiraceae bacterium]
MKLTEKQAKILALVLVVLVYMLVGMMRMPTKLDLGMEFSFLPMVSAILNTLVAICLILAFRAIKSKNVSVHKKYINRAMFLSALFLLSYVLYHFTTVETKYCGEGMMRIIYFTVLISHIVLAGISLPFILFTYILGFYDRVEKHRKLAKWVFPIWLYVAISGPLTYLLLMPCY